MNHNVTRSINVSIEFFSEKTIKYVEEKKKKRIKLLLFIYLVDYRIELSVPPKSLDEQDAENHVSFSRCRMYITNYTEILITGQKPGPDTPIGKCQYGWSYNRSSVPYESIGSQVLLSFIFHNLFDRFIYFFFFKRYSIKLNFF